MRQLIHPAQPIGVLMVAILHFVPNEDLANIVAQYRKMMAPGDYLAVSHASHAGRSGQVGPLTQLYQRTAAPLTMRTSAQIEACSVGLSWCPRSGVLAVVASDSPVNVDDHPERFSGYAVVGRRE